MTFALKYRLFVPITRNFIPSDDIIFPITNVIRNKRIPHPLQRVKVQPGDPALLHKAGNQVLNHFPV